MKRWGCWGDLKMKGKRQKSLSCGCCGPVYNRKRYPKEADLKKILETLDDKISNRNGTFRNCAVDLRK